MNLQSMTIIFIIIFLPILLISTFFVQREVDTINLQTSYDTKLIDATTDAISAFEMNTANEDLSGVSDSLRSIIEASNNVFINTLATNLGMSNSNKSKILPYIPAIVYTLYDGYYIYTPTQQPKVVTDDKGVYVTVGTTGVYKQNGKYWYNKSIQDDNVDPTYNLTYSNVGSDYGKMLYYSNYYSTHKNEMKNDIIECTTDANNAYRTTSYILKSFIPYTATYNYNGNLITINYTLDNYITVSGNINGAYYTKSGYLIDPSKVTNIQITLKRIYYGENGKEVKDEQYAQIDKNSINNYTLDEIDDLISEDKSLDKNYYDIVASKASLEYDGVKIEFSRDFKNGKWELMTDESAYSEDYTGDKMVSDNESAIKYYLKAYLFSQWISDNIKDLNENQFIYGNNIGFGENFNLVQDHQDVTANENLYYPYSKDKKFFNDFKNIENKESYFYEHKRKVIQNSIQYNLNLAMVVYNKGRGDEEYQMPLLTEPEWDKLLSNISILSFMQGLPCGFKTYNNYSIVTSRNNEIMANLDDIYYIPINGVYRKTCLDMYANVTNNVGNIIGSGVGVLTSNMADSTNNAELSTAHHIDSSDQKFINDAGNAKFFESFASREVKYDKVWSVDSGRKYTYDHVCKTCYDCILNNNYEMNEYGWYNSLNNKQIGKISLSDKDLKHLNGTSLNNYINGMKTTLSNQNELMYKLYKAELIAIGKIRNNTYKTCAFATNYGIKTVTLNDITMPGREYEFRQKIGDLSRVYEIEIVLKDNQNIYQGSNEITFLGDKAVYSCLTEAYQTLVFKNKDNNASFTLGSPINATNSMSVKIASITIKYR